MKIGLLIIAMLLISLMAICEETLEQQGNMLASEGDALFTSNDYNGAGAKYELALEKYQEAVKQGHPINDKVINMVKNCILTYSKAKNYEKLVEYFEIDNKMNPGNFKTVRNITIVYRKNLKNPQKAIETLLEFNEKYGKFESYELLAKNYSEINDYKNALVWFQKAFSLKSDTDVLKNIAAAHVKLGNNESAIKTYEEFIKTKPENKILEKVYVNLGALYESIGTIDKAVQYFNESLKLKYDNDIALKVLIINYNNKKYDTAIQLAEKLKTKASDKKNVATYYIALSQYYKGEKVNARKNFELLKNDKEYGTEAVKWIDAINSEI
ncbi:MAG: hypothetical protein PHR06_01885 [Candidatus Cloacimonetes bacterium]|nr:hypothetical protein [Candidatus Cloacimonadota bacterium]